MVDFRARLIKFGTLPGMKPLSTACRLPGMNQFIQKESKFQEKVFPGIAIKCKGKL